MNTHGNISIEDMINSCRKSGKSAIAAKLDWLRLRCLLETEASVSNDHADYTDYTHADELLNKFILSKIQKEGSDIIQQITEKNKTNELEEMFYEFLSEFDNEKEVDESWKKQAQIFIEKLNDYREMGSVDSNIGVQLMDYAKKINNDNLRYIYELIQNADDCEYSSNKNLVEVKIIIEGDQLIISYPEDGMTYSDIIAITTIGQSNKRKKKKKKIIGEKGRGFKTIFSVCDYANIHSGPFHFRLSQDSFKPEWIDGEYENGTKMILHFKENIHSEDNKEKFIAGKDLFEAIKKRYGFCEGDKDEVDKENNILRNCPIIFTNNISELTIQYNEEELHMKKSLCISDDVDTRKKGSISVEYSIENSIENNDEKDTWNVDFYWYEKEVIFTYEEYISHYKNVFKDEMEFDKVEQAVINYPIILIAPKKKETVIRNWKGNMFTYLPTFTNINAPVSIQAPFELNEDRSCMWINKEKGDDHASSDFEVGYEEKAEIFTTKWNRRLFNELFIDQENNLSLIKYAYGNMVDELKDNCAEIYDYIPAYKKNNHNFFVPQDTKYDACVDKFNSICKENEKNIIFENFKSLKFIKRLFDGELISCNNNPLFFDESVDCILSKMLQNGINDYEWLNELGIEGNNKGIPLSLIKSIDTKTYDNIVALGANEINNSNINKIDFVNYLLSKEYELTIQELNKGDDCSEYFPSMEKRKKIKAIRIQNDNQEWQYFSPEDAEIWVYILEGNKLHDGERLKTVFEETGIKDKNGNLICFKKIYGAVFSNVVGNNWDSIWNYIYAKNGTMEIIKCSFELYKELICYLGNKQDWYTYSMELLSKDENSNENRIIPSENIRTIWKVKYKEYRGDKVDGSNGNT